MVTEAYQRYFEKKLESLEDDYQNSTKKNLNKKDLVEDAFNICIKNNHPLPLWVAEFTSGLFNNSTVLKKRLTESETAYNNENYGALNDAVFWCDTFKVPLPEWVLGGVFIALRTLAIDDKIELKKWRQWCKRYKQDMKDYRVYGSVIEAREHGAEWCDVYSVASALLLCELGYREKENTVEATYKRVGKRMKTNPFRYRMLRTFILNPKRPKLSPEIRIEAMKEVEDTIRKGNPKKVEKFYSDDS